SDFDPVHLVTPYKKGHIDLLPRVTDCAMKLLIVAIYSIVEEVTVGDSQKYSNDSFDESGDTYQRQVLSIFSIASGICLLGVACMALYRRNKRHREKLQAHFSDSRSLRDCSVHASGLMSKSAPRLQYSLQLQKSCSSHGSSVKGGSVAPGTSMVSPPILSRALSKGKRFRHYRDALPAKLDGPNAVEVNVYISPCQWSLFSVGLLWNLINRHNSFVMVSNSSSEVLRLWMTSEFMSTLQVLWHELRLKHHKVAVTSGGYGNLRSRWTRTTAGFGSQRSTDESSCHAGWQCWPDVIQGKCSTGTGEMRTCSRYAVYLPQLNNLWVSSDLVQSRRFGSHITALCRALDLFLQKTRALRRYAVQRCMVHAVTEVGLLSGTAAKQKHAYPTLYVTERT
ncbi:hypothetical protein F2P81_022323, partial [Scophthalmus maximus]